MNPTKVLSVLVVAVVHLLFAIVLLHKGLDAVWITIYVAVALFYVTLHFHGLPQLREGIRRCLRSTAMALAMFLSAFFFYNFTAGVFPILE